MHYYFCHIPQTAQYRLCTLTACVAQYRLCTLTAWVAQYKPSAVAQLSCTANAATRQSNRSSKKNLSLEFFIRGRGCVSGVQTTHHWLLINHSEQLEWCLDPKSEEGLTRYFGRLSVCVRLKCQETLSSSKEILKKSCETKIVEGIR